MKRPKIRITLIDQKGTVGCHRGHKIGDCYGERKAVSHGDACSISICGYIKIWRQYSRSGERNGGICLPGC